MVASDAAEAIMAAKDISVKKYVVRLSGEEREQLEAQRIDGLPGPEATGGRRLRGCVEPQATDDTGGCTDFRWRERSQIDCAGLFQTSQGTRALDLAAVGEKGRGTANCRSRQRLADRG